MIIVSCGQPSSASLQSSKPYRSLQVAAGSSDNGPAGHLAEAGASGEGEAVAVVTEAAVVAADLAAGAAVVPGKEVPGLDCLDRVDWT